MIFFTVERNQLFIAISRHPISFSIQYEFYLLVLYSYLYVKHGARMTYVRVQDYEAKLSDFGLARDGPQGDKSHVSTRVMGTYGYAAPEYVMTGKLCKQKNKNS